MAAESEASVSYYGQCHYSHVADNFLPPTYSDVVFRPTLGRGNFMTIESLPGLFMHAYLILLEVS